MTRPSRRSVAYLPGGERHDWTGHAFLLARDIPLGIMPTWHLRKEGGFEVHISESADGAKARLFALLEHIPHYAPHSAAEAICDFVETAATQIAYRGQATFEICDEEGGPYLVPIFVGNVISLVGRSWQRLPRQPAESEEMPGAKPSSRYVALPKGSVWTLRAPAPLGTPRQHRRRLRRLERASSLTPAFALRTANLGRQFGYDFSAHRDATDRQQERLTRRWGTVLSIPRPVGTSSEYFFIARRLEFHKAQAELREHLVSSLNHALPRLAIEASVEVRGLPSAHQIETTINQLYDGHLSFKDALEVVRL